MIELPYPVVLASASPRRRELLAGLVERFEIVPAHLDEEAFEHPDPEQTARDLAEAKAAYIAKLCPDALVIAGDTVVALPVDSGFEQLAKPADEADARCMIARLQGREHLVLTGICLLWPRGRTTFVETSRVRFKRLSQQEVADYVALGESLDKAGAYAAQGKAGEIIESVEGSLSNVIGLPIERLREALEGISREAAA